MGLWILPVTYIVTYTVVTQGNSPSNPRLQG